MDSSAVPAPALLWRTAATERDGFTVIDEFTSHLDRHLARRMCAGVAAFVRSKGVRQVVLVTCHSDVLGFLNPDWLFHTPSGKLIVQEIAQRPYCPCCGTIKGELARATEARFLRRASTLVPRSCPLRLDGY